MWLVKFHHVKIFPMPHVHVLAENIWVVDLVSVRTIVLLCVTAHASYIQITFKMAQVH